MHRGAWMSVLVCARVHRKTRITYSKEHPSPDQAQFIGGVNQPLETPLDTQVCIYLYRMCADFWKWEHCLFWSLQINFVFFFPFLYSAVVKNKDPSHPTKKTCWWVIHFPSVSLSRLHLRLYFASWRRFLRCLKIRTIGSFVSKHLSLCLVLLSSHSAQ